MKYPKAIDQEYVRKMIVDGRRHMRFMISIYWRQIKAGHHFLHEHPASATSWKDESMAKLMGFPGIEGTV